jgi:predicted nucleic acid-binding protein
MTVYVDTSAFYAIVDSTDAHHLAAAQTWQASVENDAKLITSFYVVTEALALFHNRLGTEIIARFLQDNLPMVLVLWPDLSIHNRALSAMLATPGRSGPSLTDCVSLELIRTHGIERVFAYDQHFENRGFEVIG